MLMRCFDTEEGCAGGLGKIYDIDFAVPSIRDATLQNILTPLLVIHFVGIVRCIVNRGLKRDYVQQEDALPFVSIKKEGIKTGIVFFICEKTF